MYVEFASMVIIDFKAFRGRHGFALNGSGVIYIIGENRVTKRLGANGASKSALWAALTWCLFGKTPVGETTNDIKPWAGGNPCVTVMLVADGQEQLCQRTTSPKNLFTVNGQERADISEVLPLSFELFVNTILLPQGRGLFFDLQPRDKMGLIAEAQGLERWDIRSKAASDRADELDREVVKFTEELRVKEGKLEELGRAIEGAKNRSQDWNDAMQARTRTSKMALVALQKDHERLTNELGTATLAEDGALLELRHAQDARDLVAADARKTLTKLSDVKADMSSLERDIERVEEEIAELSEARICPTCGQPVKASNIKEHRAELAERKAALAKRMASQLKVRRGLVATGTELTEQLEQYETSIKEFRRRANEAGDVITRLRPEVATLKSQIDSARAVKEEVNPHLETLRDLNERRRDLQNVLKEVKEDVADAQAKAERARYWIKGFKDIKLQLIKEVLEELELVANSMIEEVGLVSWEIRCDIEKETKSGSTQRLINVSISSPESKGFVNWRSWSGGEAGRLKLIGSLALSDVLLGRAGVETNLEILDEPAIYWSTEGVQELCDFLALRAQEQEKTIMFVDHQAVESPRFAEVIKVIKGKEGAYIE